MSGVDDKIASVTLGELRQQFEKELRTIYGVDEIRQHFAVLCERRFGFTPAQVVLSLPQSLSSQKIELMKNDLKALKRNTPIQYIIGKVDFADVTLVVNTSVLIPRPETEELVHWILSTMPNNKPLRVLDIGTGSGCIALALKKKCPLWEISAWDIDEDALSVAQHNAEINGLEVHFQQVDVLAEKHPQQYWDLIVSNPPYVPEAWQKHTAPHVLAYEPNHAIFVSDESPLLFYEHITVYATQNVAANGVLFFEGHAPLMKSVKVLLQKAGFSDIVLRNDFRENPRFIRAKIDESSNTD